jgi:uncharacterized protein YrrD
MELKEGTQVMTPGGEELGRINRFVLNPETNEVTHIVVQKGWLLPEDKVIPFNLIDSATDEGVVLNQEVGDFDQLPPFEEAHYVSAEAGDTDLPGDPGYQYLPAYYWYPPHGFTGYPAYGLPYPAWPLVVTERNIPDNTTPVKMGSDVISSDDEHVGDVERIIAASDSNRATHFLISAGLLFKERKLVPAHWVKSVTEDTVYLSVPARLLENLPPYES